MLQETDQTMFGFRKLAPVVLSVCLFHIFNAKVIAYEKDPEFSRVVAKEGSDAILPCSLSTEENIEFKVFDWRKEGQKEVFSYDGGIHSNNGRSGQDSQFKRRVSHFPDQLKNGNASVKIQNTKVADRGNYTCVFPRLQPSQTFLVELLVVDPEFSRVVVKEGSDAILPCSLSTKENIESKLFDWKKDGQKEVFMYDGGKHYNNNGRSGQDVQFKGRVSHFPDQLKNGNASIKIQNTKVADSGNYTCVFPRLQPSQTFHIKLVVVGAAPKPNIQTLDATKDWSLLQCDVQGAFPKPKVEWKDRAGNILPAEEPQVSYRGERYYITLHINVTKTDHYHCVATQEEIHHQTEAETFVPFCGARTGWVDPTGWIASTFVVSILLVLVFVVEGVLFSKGIIKVDRRKSHQRHENCL